MQDFIERLRNALQQPLPGQEAQYRMAPPARQNIPVAPASARQAAVLALFIPIESVWHLVYIQRPGRNPRDRHAGQISFPGGQVEAGDADLAATALREAEEEIAAPRQDIELLGALSELYIPVSNFVVQPYVGYLDYRPTFQPQESEVENILEVPFSTFLSDTARRVTDLNLSQQLLLRDIPYFDLHGKILWGATAMITNELLAVLE